MTLWDFHMPKRETSYTSFWLFQSLIGRFPAAFHSHSVSIRSKFPVSLVLLQIYTDYVCASLLVRLILETFRWCCECDPFGWGQTDVCLGYAKHVLRINKYNLSVSYFIRVINIPFFPVWMRSNDREIVVAALVFRPTLASQSAMVSESTRTNTLHLNAILSENQSNFIRFRNKVDKKKTCHSAWNMGQTHESKTVSSALECLHKMCTFWTGQNEWELPPVIIAKNVETSTVRADITNKWPLCNA